MIDVAQERPRRPDDEHARRLELLAVVVQQVRGAVKRDGRLAGPRASLDHERPRQRSADRRILLRLDGGDDVAHPVRSACRKRREQGPFARQFRAIVEGGDVQDVVLKGDDLPPLGREVTAAYYARRFGRGCGVERACRGGPPVREEGGVVGVGEPYSPDVQPRTVREVEPAEAQAVLNGVELGDAILVQSREGVALRTVLRRARGAGAANGREASFRFRSDGIEPRI